MDQIHHIRELFYSQGKNISEIAKETGLNWKTVQKYVDKQDFNLPKPEAPKASVSKLDKYKEVIDYWLTEDRKAPRKQRHTARRVYQRLKEEYPSFPCSYRTVAEYVAAKKKEL
jgi:transposase